jgi:hypothetical protein
MLQQVAKSPEPSMLVTSNTGLHQLLPLALNGPPNSGEAAQPPSSPWAV